MFLSKLWYFGAVSKDIKPGQHKHVELLGKPVLIGRGFDGQAFALRDICPHRGVLLSSGQLVQKNGQTQIECPYHGWRFGTEGKCAAIPSLTEAQAAKKDLSKISTRAFAVLERQGLIWIYQPIENPVRQKSTEQGNAQDSQPLSQPPVLDLVGDTKPKLVTTTIFDCHVDHAVIGLMDPAHIAFIHRQWWWRTEKSMHEKNKLFGPVERGFSMLPHTPSSNSYLYRLLGARPQTEIRFQLPGIRVEYVQFGQKYIVGFTAVTPVNENQTRITIALYWDHVIASLIPNHLIKLAVNTFVRQDRDAVNAQQTGLAYDPKLMLIHDADVQAKWYFALKKAWNTHLQSEKPFVNPVKKKTLRWRS